ncbi:MAG TPA: DegV family protein [Candidatus Limnocylindrales bacterium]|nr:DegV family protein [Candidatus Limnocylindrales bacterium]
MTRVAIVADSAGDLTAKQAQNAGISVVPLLVTFGEREYRAGVDLSSEDFYAQLTAPGAPFPKTAAAAPGTFRETFERLLAEGADEIVYVGVGAKLSATLGSAKVARDMLPDRTIRIVDSNSASMGAGLLALRASEMAAAGASSDEIAADLERRREGISLYVVLETLEYLKRGGRISPARAAIGSVLSVKPIITILDGVVETADKPRTRGRARERLIELITATSPERVAILHSQSDDVEAFATELAAATKVPRAEMLVNVIGASVGPHVGPGAFGAVTLCAR